MFSVLKPYFTRVNIQYEEVKKLLKLDLEKTNVLLGKVYVAIMAFLSFEVFWAQDRVFHGWLKGAEEFKKIVVQTVDKWYS